MKLETIVEFLDGFLNVRAHGEDTGLKHSGGSDVHRIGGAVDLSLEAIEQAKATECDLLFVHHDAWSSTDADLVDRKYGLLKKHNISLYVSHDPLDLHPEVGTAAALVQTLGWKVSSTFMDGLGVLAEPIGNPTVEEAARHVAATLGAESRLVSTGPDLQFIAVIAGWGARPEWMAEAGAKGATTFLSGEAIHFGRLYARESGMNLILAGHYATELPAVRALLDHVAREYGLETELIEDAVSAGL